MDDKLIETADFDYPIGAFKRLQGLKLTNARMCLKNLGTKHMKDLVDFTTSHVFFYIFLRTCVLLLAPPAGF